MKPFFTIIFVCLFVTCSFATPYYISASGNDNANGLSIVTAWRTITKLNTVKLFPGDIVSFEGGVTFPGSINIGSDDYGTAAQPVIITSYGTGRALIDAGTSVGILVINTGGVEISNINFMGGAGNNNAGIYITMDRTDSTLQHIVIQDVEVSRFYNYGILVSSNNTTKGFKDVLINRVLSHDNLNGGIISVGSGNPAFTHQNITVSNSKVYNNKGIPGYPDNTGNGIVLTGVDGVLIDNCEAYNNGESSSYGGGGPVGIWLATVKNGIIQNCESHHNKTGTIDGGGFDLDGGCQNSVIQYCYSHDNQGPGYLLAEYGSGTPYRDNIIRYNISENDGTDLRTGGNGGIYVWGGGTGLEVTNSQIYNNTIYTLQGRASLVLSDIYFINLKISNNIFYAPAGTRFIDAQEIDSTKAHLLNNDYYTASTPEFKWGSQIYSSLAAWKAAAPTQERRSNVNYGLAVNPMLTAPGTGKDGYRLNNASPLINAGLNMSNCGPRDYYGGLSKVGSSQDIGAYEQQDAPGDTQAPSVPTALNALYTGSTFVHLDWSNSTDNVGVTAYDVYVGGVKKYTTTESAITADSLTAGTAYSFTVKALDLAGNSSAFSTAVSATTLTAANGLNYRYYEGGWNTLPNFNALTPVKTGLSPNTDLSIRNKNDSFAVVWEGTINITTPGSYTFETVSDEGSRFYFNSVYKPGAVALVNNDSLHIARSASATVNIAAAGLYPIAITYFEKTATESMQVFYSGPGITRQLIPNTSFNPPPPGDTEAPSVPTALNALYTGSTFVHLDWSNSTDNVGVTAYDVYVGGVKKYTTTESAITADSLTAGTAYSFTVKALDLAGNSSAFSTAVSATTLTAANGLNYRYYEGGWNTLPNFNALTPVKTGLSPNTDLSIRNKNDSFAVVWEGTINITTPGSYTFETVSDEGSRFYFNSVYKPGAVPLVNNDSLHTARSASATVNIAAAGLYPIAITYFEKTATESMQVFYSGPGITRQLIPNTSFNPPPPGDTEAPSVPTALNALYTGSTFVHLDWSNSTDNVGVTAYDVYVGGVKKYTTTESAITADSLTAGTAYSFTVKALDLAGNNSAFSTAVSATTLTAANGLNYRYYEGGWNTLPNFNALTPVKTGLSPNTDLSIRNKNDSFAVVWEGTINITTPGSYTFETVSDEGSRFYFNSVYKPGAVALVNNDSLHTARSASATVNIAAAGLYPIAITYFEKTATESMQVFYSGPGIARQLIPNTSFNPPPPGDTEAPGVPTNLQVVSATSTSINLDWNDATDNVGVTGYDIYVGGVKRYTSTASQVTADGLTAATSYTFTVKALDLAGNSSAFSTAVTGSTTTASSSNGLNYRYYEGSWSVLPNFNTLAPVKTGTTANIDLSVRTPGVNDNFGFVWEGYINITTPGNYTFETLSDDGSRFYFNTLYSPTATALVNNDGLHAPASAFGTVNIPAAGVYPVSITFFEKDGGETMQLYWTGPGIARQLVPNTAFMATPPADNVPPGVPTNLQVVSASSTSINLDWSDATDNVGVTGYDIYVGGVKRYTSTASQVTADGLTAATSYTFTVKALDLAGNSSAFSTAVTGSTTTASSSNGLNYRYYEGSWSVLPNFNTLTPVKTGTTANIDLSVRTPGVNDNFGFVWEGYINITTPGNYTFETLSDDGSRFYFNTLYSPTATALVNNDGLHAPASVSASVNIPAAGVYPVSITFFEKDGGETMQLYWTGPGIARQLVPNTAFMATPPADNVPPGVPTNLQVVSASSTSINLDWSDATDNVGVTGYDIYVGGVKRYTSTASQVTADGLTAATSYTFTVKALDLAGNSSAFSTAVTGSTTTASSSNGLNYRYYEGSWSVLPNFNTLTPVKTGTTANIDLSVRTPGVNDNFGFVWEGYINITTPGNYTFETLSDDGSRFYFNTLYSPTATALVNNDGLHAPASVSASVNIPAAGVYPVSITFFEKDGGETMQLYWTGPGIARQLVPNTAFTSASQPDNIAPSIPANLSVVSTTASTINLDWSDATDNVGVTGYDIYVGGVKRYTSTASQVTADGLAAGTSYTFTVKAFDQAGNSSAFSAAVTGSTTTASSSNGLNYRYYHGTWDVLPDFNALTPVKTGSSPNIDLNIRNRNDSFGVVWEGYINITTPGNYTFETLSDDGSRFYFNTLYSPTATALVNNDGLHAPASAFGTVNIPAAGVYPVAITFFEKDGGETMQLYWTGPGIARQLVPNSAFTSGNGSLISGFIQTGRDADALPAGSKSVMINRVYPNPYDQNFSIDLYNPTETNDIRVGLYDLKGKLIHTYHPGNLVAGNTTLNIHTMNRQLAEGIYLVRVDVNGIPSKIIKLIKAKK